MGSTGVTIIQVASFRILEVRLKNSVSVEHHLARHSIQPQLVRPSQVYFTCWKLWGKYRSVLT